MPELSEDDKALVGHARDAAHAAYSPYSGFPVGAAVLADIGVVAGCNVENASYGLAMCAERVALFAAVAQGARHILQLAVSCVQANPAGPIGLRMPCGACRQVIAELMEPDATVVIDGVGILCVRDLLPVPFRLERTPFLDLNG